MNHKCLVERISGASSVGHFRVPTSFPVSDQTHTGDSPTLLLPKGWPLSFTPTPWWPFEFNLLPIPWNVLSQIWESSYSQTSSPSDIFSPTSEAIYITQAHTEELSSTTSFASSSLWGYQSPVDFSSVIVRLYYPLSLTLEEVLVGISFTVLL